MAHEHVTLSGGPYELQADLFLPGERDVVPGIVWNHGSERAPSLRWHNTAPSEQLAAEMVRAGNKHRMRIFEAFGSSPRDGHAGFCNHGQAQWGPNVLDFIARA